MSKYGSSSFADTIGVLILEVQFNNSFNLGIPCVTFKLEHPARSVKYKQIVSPTFSAREEHGFAYGRYSMSCVTNNFESSVRIIR